MGDDKPSGVGLAEELVEQAKAFRKRIEGMGARVEALEGKVKVTLARLYVLETLCQEAGVANPGAWRPGAGAAPTKPTEGPYDKELALQRCRDSVLRAEAAEVAVRAALAACDRG